MLLESPIDWELEVVRSSSPLDIQAPCFIHRVPPEVLSQIFFYCKSDDKFVHPNASTAPLLLMQVCSRWKEVAIASPDLWDSLSITRPTRPLDTGFFDFIRTWMSRTDEHPLSLSLSAIEGDAIWAQPVLDILFQYSLRWTHVRMYLPSLHSSLIQVPKRVSTPWLTTWELNTGTSDDPRASLVDEHTVGRLVSMLRSSPRLRQVAWTTQQLDTGIPFLLWKHLTHVYLNYSISLSDCLDILSQAITIEQANFQQVVTQARLSRSLTTLPLLNTLTLSLSATQCLGEFFDVLMLPALSELDVNLEAVDFERAFPWPHASFMSMLARSKCPLQRLALEWVSLSEIELLECLEGISEYLAELVIIGPDGGLPNAITDRTVQLLTPGADAGPTLCPHLVSIEIDRCMSCTDGYVADMVEVRWREGAVDQHGWRSYLTRFYVHFLDDWHDQDTTRLRALVREGFPDMYVFPIMTPRTWTIL